MHLSVRSSAAVPGFFLILFPLFSGCLVVVPLPLSGPTPNQGNLSPTSVTQTDGTRIPGTVTMTAGVVQEETPGTPTSVTGEPTLPLTFSHALPKGTAYAYADNLDFHALSVSVDSTQMRTGFYYTPAVAGSGLIRWEAEPGNKFLLVGVGFSMTGIHREGKSSLFMTPLACSFQVLKDGVPYSVLNASDIPNMTDFYIRDVGSMYRDRFIDKENDGSGFLVFEVPEHFDPKGAYVTFCPRNLDSWAQAGFYRSPDDWDCIKNPVVWALG